MICGESAVAQHADDAASGRDLLLPVPSGPASTGRCDNRPSSETCHAPVIALDLDWGHWSVCRRRNASGL